jgi:hypothetical protein
MVRLLIGLVVVSALAGCVQREPTPCIGSCPRVPDLEPLGKLCTLSNSSCQNGILVCYYKCVDVESGRIPLDVEIRSTPSTNRP